MPRPSAHQLDGLTPLPALINAHDHMEMNHVPRTKYRDDYPNTHEWNEAISANLSREPLRSLRAAPLRDRVFIGGLKNLLSGALLVVHHNPPHRELFAADFPVRVVRRYRWAHSLHFSMPDVIHRTYRQALRYRIPFYIHISEGTDAVAEAELGQLADLLDGDLSQVVLIGGVGLIHADIPWWAPQVRGLVITPTSQQYLLGAVADAQAWIAAGGKLALGSDSRLTAEGDLLDELRAAHALYGDLPTEAQAIISVKPKADDWIVVRENAPLHTARRRDLALVVRGGIPRIGDPEMMARFPQTPTVPARLDGEAKAIERSLARQIAACSLKEPGLELLE